MNTWYKAKGIFSILAGLGFFAATGHAAWEKGERVPDLAGYDLEGDAFDLEGKVTYLDFWASWCPPCKASFPAMEELHQKYGEAGFQVVAVSVDSTKKAMQKFVDRAQPSFAIVRDAEQALVADAGIEVMPTSFLVDAQGVIRAVHFGWRGDETKKQLESEIKELIAEAKR